MQQKRIIAIHLLNDFSGSPLVLRQSLELLSRRFNIHLFTSATGSGFLTDIPQIKYHKLLYRWRSHKWITLINFLLVQVYLFVRLVIYLRSRDIVYINTLLPAGAALAGKIRGCKVIYHIHEVSLSPPLLKSVLVKIADTCASDLIFVSQFVQQHYQFSIPGSAVIYNALPENFTLRAERLKTVSPPGKAGFTVLMACSLKKYKGVDQFIKLAGQMPYIRFILVLNAAENDVAVFRQQATIGENCTICPVQADLLLFYQEADVVLNLSLPDEWIETFGMTVLEGMYFGRPAIIPPVGGITELITNGKEGFQADARDLKQVFTALHNLYSDQTLYSAMSKAAFEKAQLFSQKTFKRSIYRFFFCREEKLFHQGETRVLKQPTNN